MKRQFSGPIILTRLGALRRFMRRGKSIGDEVAVGPAEGLAPDTLAELERIQAQVFASYGMKESSRGKIVNRMKQLDED